LAPDQAAVERVYRTLLERLERSRRRPEAAAALTAELRALLKN
jgi:hypothetical protein